MTTNLETLWSGVITELKLSLSLPIFRTFFEKTKLLSSENQVATIACPSSYLADLIEKRYYSLIKASLDRLGGGNHSLIFVVGKMEKKQEEKPGPLFSPPETPKNIIANDNSPNRFNLKQNFNFENFVVGNANHFAFAAAQGVVKNPGTSYNPFFIWGGVGVGKTHLMQAIGNEITKLNPSGKILYFNAEVFGNELVTALKEHTMNKFRHKYRNVDLFLADDIQFLAGKEYFQDEFFHTFNALYLAGKQIVLTSDRKPEEIQPLKDRLTSRFMGGLIVDIQPPDYEMRVAILKQKTEQRGINLPEDALSFLAKTISSNARELEGALTQVWAKSQTKSVPLSLEFVKDYFGVKKKNEVKRVSPKKVITTVARFYKIKSLELTGACRKKKLADARHIAAYFLRKDLGIPLTQIGGLLGGRDHTSIMHATDKIDRLFSVNQEIRHQILEIRKVIFS